MADWALTWRIAKAWLGIMLKGILRGELLTGWFLLSKEPVKIWLPIPRCLDRFCSERYVYLLRVWVWPLKEFAKKPSTFLEYHENRLMEISQTWGESYNVTVTMPAPTLHVERPWAVRRWLDQRRFGVP